MKKHPSSSAPAPVAAAPSLNVGEEVRLSFRLLGFALALIPFVLWLGGPWLESLTELKWPFGAASVFIFLLLSFAEERASSAERGRGAAWWREPFALGGVLIGVGLLFSALCSPVRGLGLLVALRELVYVALALCLASRRPRRRELGWVLGCLLAAMGVQALLALAQYFFAESMHAFLPLTIGKGRAAMIGTIGNPEYLASWLATGLTAAALLAVRSPGPGERGDPLRRLAATAGVAILLAIFISGGRGAILASAGALALAGVLSVLPRRHWGATQGAEPQEAEFQEAMPAQTRPKKKRWIIGGGVALGLALLAALWATQGRELRNGMLPARLADLINVHSPSIRHRLGLLAITSRMALDHPWAGAGPGRYGAAYSETQARLAETEDGIGFWALGDVLRGNYVGEAHCDPLQWWAEYGLLPLVGLLLMLARALTAAWPALRRAPLGDPLRAALWVALLTLALNMWTSFPLHRPVRMLTFWTLLGLVAALRANGPATIRSSSDRP